MEQYNGVGKDSVELTSTVVGRGQVICETMEGLLSHASSMVDDIAKLGAKRAG